MNPLFPTTPSSNHHGLRDNHSRGTVGEFLRHHLKPGADLDFVTAYFTVFAFEKLRSELEALGRIRLLFGEAAFLQQLDPEKTGAAYVLKDDGIVLSSGLNQRHLARACATWIREKVEVRSVTRTGFLHGKMAHITRGEVTAAILGSSNFTTRGLGLATSNNNVELNLIVSDDRDRDELRRWFQDLWDNPDKVEDVKQRVLDFLEQVYRDQSPQFIYFKTLYELFRDSLDSDKTLDESLTRIRLPETQVWNSLFSFQKDGAKSAIKKLLEFNGCILADSVGLGKTYEALAVIKFFELRNEKVLVLCPHKLRENWELYPIYAHNRNNPFTADRFGFTVLAHTDLSRDSGASGAVPDLAAFNWAAFDLVVIDESHNFRNNAAGRPREDGSRRATRYERLIQEIIQSGVRTKVLLLSATPVNNELADLRNQLSFIAGGDATRDPAADAAFENNLGIASLKATTRDAQTRFTNWAGEPPEKRNKRDLIHVLGGDFLKLLDALTIARSRRHIARHYAGEMKRLGGFPRRRPPVSLATKIDARNQFPGYDDLVEQLGAYKLWLFQPAAHLKEDLPASIREGYTRRIGGFTQEGRERILTGMMKVGLLKRLESSIDSFRSSIRRILAKIDRLEQRMDRFEQFQSENPDLDFDTFGPEDLDEAEQEDEELAAALEVGRRITFKMAHLDLDKWRTRLAEDRTNLRPLLEVAEQVSPERDAKLAALKARIADKAANPPIDKEGRPNRKLLVFSAFSDTARFLYDQM
ncbi:MAG: ATP-dependent helicase, partial [Puniceicoccaceae bacterium]